MTTSLSLAEEGLGIKACIFKALKMVGTLGLIKTLRAEKNAYHVRNGNTQHDASRRAAKKHRVHFLLKNS